MQRNAQRWAACLSVVLTRVSLCLSAPSVCAVVCAISYNSFGATQQQEQSPFAAASSTFAQPPMQMQTQPLSPGSFYAQQSPTSRASRITPLYQGLPAAQRATGSTRRSRSTARASPGQSDRPRARTPLPAPPRAADLYGRTADATARMSKSATFGSPSRVDAPQYLKGQTSRRAYAYAHLPPVPLPVFDPLLPSPTVVIHGSAARSLGFNKSVQERKHRGTSRNTSGGFYTS